MIDVVKANLLSRSQKNLFFKIFEEKNQFFMNSGINFELLKHPQDPSFLDELDEVPYKITPREGRTFFNMMITALNKEIPNNISKSILKTLGTVIQDERQINTFINGNFISSLPLAKTQIKKSIFDFLYLLVSLDVNSLDSEFANAFSETLLPSDPSKTLTLFAIFSKKFNEADDPWPIVDLLFLKSETFTTQDYVQDYLTLLVYLVKTYPIYRKERSKHAWKKMMQMTTSEDIATVRYAYYCLSDVATYIECCKVNSSLIRKHLKDDNLQATVVSFLLVADLNTEYLRDDGLLYVLLHIATRDLKATLILMKLVSLDGEIAKQLILIGGWLLKKLPTMTDTLRLVLVLFKNKSARKGFCAIEDFPTFLQIVSKTKNPGILTTICTMVRRLPMTQEFVAALSESGFIETFYAACDAADDDTCIHSALLLTDRLLEGGYTPEFLDMCDTISVILSSSNNALMEPAAYVAVNLALHKKCLKRLLQKGIDQFFEDNASVPSLKKAAKQFFKIIGQ